MIKKFGEHELIEEAISKVKEISYILEDEEFSIKYDNQEGLFSIIPFKNWSAQGKTNRQPIFTKGVSYHFEFQKEVKESYYWKEYIDRLKYILSKFHLLIYVQSDTLIINVYIMNSRQKRRLHKQQL